MPYITEDKRQVLDRSIEDLHRCIVDLELDGDSNNTQCNLSYAITRLLRMVYGTHGNYQNINDAIGLLECVKLEHYNTCAAPYQHQQKYEHGDVHADKRNIYLSETIVKPNDTYGNI